MSHLSLCSSCLYSEHHSLIICNHYAAFSAANTTHSLFVINMFQSLQWTPLTHYLSSVCFNLCSELHSLIICQHYASSLCSERHSLFVIIMPQSLQPLVNTIHSLCGKDTHVLCCYERRDTGNKLELEAGFFEVSVLKYINPTTCQQRVPGCQSPSSFGQLEHHNSYCTWKTLRTAAMFWSLAIA